MFKYLCIFAAATALSMTAYSQENKKMNFDFSSEMVKKEEEKSEIEITIQKENNVIFQGTSIFNNGKVYPLLQIKEDAELAVYPKGQENKDLRDTHYLVQFAWHMNKDKNMWAQLFMEEFERKIERKEITKNNQENELEKNEGTKEIMGIEPAAIKNSYNITISTVDGKEAMTTWGDYKFTVKIKRK